MIFFCYSVCATVSWIAIIIYLLVGFKKIGHLKAQPMVNTYPSVVIIIAVRNEEDDLENALQSICHINYPNYRIMMVNDRSTDGTATILEKFTNYYPQINVATITNLPGGWLGKNNALYQGYLNGTEEWMLFTDADIEFHPDTLNKAMGYALRNRLDHLCVLPEVISRSGILNSVLGTFTMMLMLYLRPWNASNPKSKASIGVGAFNLIRRDAYEKAGTHTRIKLRPDDDLKLGELVKAAGLRQDVLSGQRCISLEWYKNLREFVNGLMKNTFSVSGYKISKALVNFLSTLICIGLPVPLMLIFGSAAERIMAVSILFFQVVYMAIVLPNKWWYAFMIPFGGILMAYIIARSAILTIKQGGIYWRDSFYSLDMLRGEV